MKLKVLKRTKDMPIPNVVLIRKNLPRGDEENCLGDSI